MNCFTCDTFVCPQDVNKAGKESFNSESGDYVMSLLIGDSAVEQPLEWEIVCK